MPGQTAVEKILSRVIGRGVTRGEIIFPEPELITCHDWYVLQVGQAMETFGVKSFHSPERVAFFTDHEPLAVSVQAAERQKKVREIAGRYGVERFFDVGRGGLGHIFGIEAGIARPGMFASGYDTHLTSYGAIGCFGTAIVTEVSELLACGSVWLEVPRTVRVILHGEMEPGVFVRDVAQALIGSHPAELFDDAVIEFTGPAAEAMSIDQRLILVNTPMEVGARTGFFPPDAVISEYCARRGIDCGLAAISDDDADFCDVIEMDLTCVEPQLACPPVPDNVVPVKLHLGQRIDQAFVGSCAGGTLADLEVTARYLDGSKIAPHVRLIVTPATQQIARDAAQRGLIETFIAAGAIVTPPGCGPCAGGRIAPLADGEVSLNTGTRNDFGRLGSHTARIFLASPATVAHSAVVGCISDPRSAQPERR